MEAKYVFRIGHLWPDEVVNTPRSKVCPEAVDMSPKTRVNVFKSLQQIDLKLIS